MGKVIIETIDGVETATAIIRFDMGKVLRDKASEDGKSHTVAIAMNIEGMVSFYEKLLYEKAQDGDEEGFKETLEQYNIFMLNRVIGVESTPLKFNEAGELQGLSESVEVEFKTNIDKG